MRALTRRLGLLVVAVLLGMPSAQAQAQISSAPSLLQQLTAELMMSNAAYRHAEGAERQAALASLHKLAAARQQALLLAMERDPSEVIRFALPTQLAAGLPATVPSEHRFEAEGVLEILYEDSDGGAKLRYVLQTATERLHLHFASHAPDLLTGARVRVRGVRSGGELALDSGSTTPSATSTTNLEVLSTALPNTFGAQKTLVILVNFQDKITEQYTLQAAYDVAFNQVSKWDSENSFGQTWLVGDVAGWYTLPISSTSCDTNSIASYAKQAAQNAGYVLSNYSRFVYGFPQNSCGWWGLGTVGGNPSNAWINGTFSLKVLSHEMGHNFGLFHSHTNDCGTSVICSSGTASDYGDWIDNMGSSQAGHFSAFQKERLGWLNYGAQPPITTVSTSGSYQIGSYAAQDGNVKALKVLQSAASNTYYYVEYRQPVGADSFISGYSDLMQGVVLHTAVPTSGNTNNLLDITPTIPSSFSHPGLMVGTSYTDPAAGISVSPVSAGSVATVDVTFGPVSCAHENPTTVLSPSQGPTVAAGAAVSFTVSVTNNDNSGCGTSVFNLTGLVPNGWTGNLATSSVTLTPGTSTSTSFSVTSPAGTSDGIYELSITTANALETQYSSSDAATYVVSAPLLVTLIIATDRTSYSLGQTVTITTTALSGNTAQAGISVDLNLLKPNGGSITKTPTTGRNGSAVWKYKLQRQDPKGVYRIEAKPAGSMQAAATASFDVQ